ncbi:MAG: AMIN domain-containing protein [Terriglobales bacterium]
MRSLPLAVLSFLLLPALAAYAAAEPASVVDIRVVRDNGFVRVEITLSQPVRPIVKTTEAPERLVLVLPGTVSAARQKLIPVGAAGVKSVRMGLHSSDPPETDVVIDLEPGQAHSHGLQVQGNKLVLAVSAGSAVARRVAPTSGGSVSPLVGALSKREPSPNLSQTNPEVAMAPRTTAAANPPNSSSPVAAPSQPSAVQGSSTSRAAPELRAANRSTIESANTAPPALTMRVPNSDLRLVFTVKYVAQGAAYLDGGRSSGLTEGMKLEIKDDVKASSPGKAPTEAPAGSMPAGSDADGSKKVVAELEVISVAETSAVTEIKSPAREVKKGDLAYLSAADQAALVAQRTLSSTRKYPQVVSFTEGDPLEEEARAEVPRPPMPSVNRARGRIGFDYGGIHSGDGLNSTQVGMVLRADITRIGGTYWNLDGFWRGRLQSQASNVQPTLQDLINRTYTLNMTYDNPNSAWVMGVGRLYLPWAPSLDTIDGGYFGRRLHKGVTAGVFGGSSPDPASWNYQPGRRLAGTFINFEGGSFEGVRYTSTVGAAMSTVYGQFDRPLGFIETGLFYKRIISIYDSAQVDEPPGTVGLAPPGAGTPSPGLGLARSFVTVRVQPIERLSFDLNHNYFRDVPTFDPNLIGTGLLDKYLFQGFSAGVRGEIVRHVTLYTTLGASSRSGDVRNSINQMYGVTLDRIWRTGIRADVHYSHFSSSFGDGVYEVVSLSRNVGERFHFEVLGGQQTFTSSATSDNRSRFVTSMIDMNLGARYFVSGGLTLQRGNMMNYDQWFTMLGYRFDNRSNHR